MEAVQQQHNGRGSSAGPATKTATSEARREYLRNYYRRNRERALAYQREYNRRYKRKSRAGQGGSEQMMGRPATRDIFTPRDITRSSGDKTTRMIEQILKQLI